MDIPSYLRRLGRPDLLGAPATLETLTALHAAHVERVPYEVLDIWLGRPTGIDPAESAARIVSGRGGYCYHLNGAFAALATAMGFRVGRHVGGVHTADAPPAITGNHLVLTVELPEGRYLADLGLGDALHEPLPLAEGRYRQGPFEYGMRPSVVAPGGWRLEHDPSGSFAGMDFALEETEMSAFTAMHEHLTTSPESGFVRTAVVQRRDRAGVDNLRGLVLTRLGHGAHRTTLETAADYFAALADVFGLTLEDATEEEKALLWKRVHAAHQAWLNGTDPAVT
ncbi:arylamine N-acetyltransferase [Nonomuraea sp. NPDC050310]|uniref:arylamine N-acetyltransferase family protein n=1 Tax=Nonomuraea sp. NPDC050310 TaxID=3154935 RepID=UPI0033E77A37